MFVTPSISSTFNFNSNCEIAMDSIERASVIIILYRHGTKHLKKVHPQEEKTGHLSGNGKKMK